MDAGEYVAMAGEVVGVGICGFVGVLLLGRLARRSSSAPDIQAVRPPIQTIFID
jgi:hypothetical protein